MKISIWPHRIGAWVLSLASVAVLAVSGAGPVSAEQIGHIREQGATGPSCPSNPTEVHAIVGRLHTCNGMILNANDQLVRITALEFGGLAVGDNDTATPVACRKPSPPRDYAGQDLARWGFNSIELMISWQNLEPTPPTVHANGTVTHYWDKAYLATLDDTIKSFTDHGVAVILMMVQARWSTAFRDLSLPNGRYQACGSGMPDWLYPGGGGLPAVVRAELDFFHNVKGIQGQFAAAWKMVAARYADNPLVVGAVPLTEAYDILAQPYPGTEQLRPRDLRLAAFYTRIGRAIHEANSNLLIIFWDQKSTTTKLFAVARKPRVADAVYGAEFYSSSWYPKGYQRLDGYYQRASSWGLPFTIGEFTLFNETISWEKPFPNWQANSKAAFNYATQRHVGWAICCYGQGSFMSENDPHRPKLGILPILREHGF